MTARESVSEELTPQYISKKVVLNGQTVTLYSINGATWLSTPDQIPEVMARLENTRVLLADPKAAEGKTPSDGKSAEPAVQPAPAAPKATTARYRMRGPKPRPILMPDGSLAPPSARNPVSCTDTEFSVIDGSMRVIAGAKKTDAAESGKSVTPASSAKKITDSKGGKKAPVAKAALSKVKAPTKEKSTSKSVDSKKKSEPKKAAKKAAVKPAPKAAAKKKAVVAKPAKSATKKKKK